MARKDTRARFLKALQEHDARIYRAFVEAMAALRNTAWMDALERAIEAGDISAAMRALNMAPEALDEVNEAVRQAFRAGASYQIGTAPTRLVRGLAIRFQASNPRAVAYLERRAAAMVAEVVEEQRKVLRHVITEATRAQRTYSQVALDVAGRMDGNSRKGGLVGLLEREAQYVSNARAQLQELDSGYFTRTLRDKRFDRTVAKAIREGKPLAPAQIDQITGRYSDRLLAARGRRIARTESNAAMQAGRREATEQMIDRGEALPSEVTKEWRSSRDRETRDSHREVAGTTRKWGEPFENGLQYPHEEGAPPAEVVFCRCTMHTTVDYAAVARRIGTL